ncbi:hypothetical protein ZIOFF_017111 [Zingiber officinale]|uniref:Integrase catalytic domain-containing protein n=1 Tax=Zingiber officinale TaxID=94328 RepID=A0A8J5LI35_ZINOF|nr:hypothetical protein ZIOFF_017111 [Zingiber officinale]
MTPHDSLHTPQNGVVERRNRTVMTMARSLLKGTHMPIKFWGEPIMHAVYLLNRHPTKALGECTPFEAWIGRKPHLAHLRVFSYVAYVKNTSPHLKKLDDRCSLMVYLGVEEGCKAHRVFDSSHGKLQINRDVMFQENYEWTWNASANKDENLPKFMVVDAFDTDKMEDCNATKHPMEPKTQLHKDLEGTPVDTTEYKHIIGYLTYLLYTRYLNGTIHFGLVYMKESQEIEVEDSDTFIFEAEFMAATTAACHALWLRSLASELTGVEPKSVTLFVDNKSVIALIKNLIFHGHSKHIDTRFHFIRECIEMRQIVVEFVNIGEQRADILTKALSGVKLAAIRQLLSARDLESSVVMLDGSKAHNEADLKLIEEDDLERMKD